MKKETTTKNTKKLTITSNMKLNNVALMNWWWEISLELTMMVQYQLIASCLLLQRLVSCLKMVAVSSQRIPLTVNEV